jgi:hypothetical protein
MRIAAACSWHRVLLRHRPARVHRYPRCDGDSDRYDPNPEIAREVIGMSHVKRVFQVCLLAVYAVVLFPTSALASGDDVGENVGGLLKHYAGEMYGGIVGVISLMFLLNRRYTELAVFLFAAIVVAWMVFAPSDISKAAEGIGQQVFA